MAFVQKLDAEALAYFNEVGSKTFALQAQAFLDAYWPEVHEDAEFIFSVAYQIIVSADMYCKGVQYVHLYEEGSDLDFDIALYFYEQLCKYCEEPKNRAQVEKYPRSLPEMMTAIKRKQELRDKVDVNFDGRVSFLEYLLYQYRDFANPADFVTRSMASSEEHPEITKARMALEEVNKRIRAYEAERARLTEESQSGTGVKALRAKNLLAQLDSSPLAEELRKALITAEAAVRIAVRKFGGAPGAPRRDSCIARGENPTPQSSGSLFWMQRDLEEKKRKYGRVEKKN